MPTTPDQRKLRHTATAAPTEDNHHAPKPPSCRVPSTTFKKECDDDDAAARTNPRISPGTRRVEGGRGSPDALQEGWRRPQASPRWCRQDPTWISPDLSRPPPRTNLRLHHTRRPPTCANSHEDTAVVSPRPTKRGRPDPNETPEDKDRQHRSHEGGNNLHRLRR